MAAGILGEKIGMSRVFTDEGKSIPVTIILAGPCRVIQKKDIEKDGYNAIQLGYKSIKKNKTSKPSIGHFNNAKVEPLKYLREFKIDNLKNYEVGQEIKVDIFKQGEKVNVIGTSKGKGFAGGIKRHNFSGGPKTHGQKEYFRSVGSVGATDAARVFKGKKLPGHMGMERVNIKNMEIVRVDIERNLLLVKGSVPGAKGEMLIINKGN